MSTLELRRLAKKRIDALAPEQLRSVVDFIGYVSSMPSAPPRPGFDERMKQATTDLAAGKVVPASRLRRKS